jgi:Ribonuclease G/E
MTQRPRGVSVDAVRRHLETPGKEGNVMARRRRGQRPRLLRTKTRTTSQPSVIELLSAIERRLQGDGRVPRTKAQALRVVNGGRA